MFNSQIIAILAAILFPVFARAREKARQTSCLSNLKQLALSFHMYAQDYDETMLPARLPYADTPSDCFGTGWSRIIEPYIKNRAVLVCPSDLQPTGEKTLGTYQFSKSYMLNYSLHALNGGIKMAAIESPATTVDVFDGTGHPACNASNAWHPDYWPNGTFHTRDSRIPPRHNGMANFAFADGHAKPMTAPETTKGSPNMW